MNATSIRNEIARLEALQADWETRFPMGDSDIPDRIAEFREALFIAEHAELYQPSVRVSRRAA